MKRILLLIKLFSIMVSMMIIITGCSSYGEVTQNQIETDLESHFAQENWVIENLNIDRLQTNEKVKTVYITVDVSLTNAKVTRSYILTYNYYDRGGWILDDCKAYEKEQWTAIPNEPLSLSKGEIVDLIFDVDGGKNYYLIRDVVNRSYYFLGQWGNVWEGDNPNDNVDNIEWSNIESKTSAIIHLSREFETNIIFEDIRIDWSFDPIKLIWNIDRMESISSQMVEK